MNRLRLPRFGPFLLSHLMAFALGCAPEALLTDPEGNGGFSRVFLMDTELLAPPAVGRELAFKVSHNFAIDGDDASAGQAAGFLVTLTTADPESLIVRLVDKETGAVTLFTSVDPPATAAERSTGSKPCAFNDTVRAALRAGRGVYWRADGEGGADSRSYRLAILIPEARLGPFARLEMFTRQADDGTPIGAARIELVDDFFYLVVLGDSVQWGNGLREDDKMSALVTEVIEREIRRKVILQRYAQSGAKIVPEDGDGICEINCIGEVPTITTSIRVQVDQIRRAELVDLVLMDGCINDVGVGTILDPQVSPSTLAESSERFCGAEMANLLEKVHSTAPQAPIVVTGYFQMVGPQSDLFALQAWLSTQEIEPAGEDAINGEGAGDETPGKSATGEDDDEGGDTGLTPNGDGTDGETSAADDSGDDATGDLDLLVDVLTNRSIAFHETARASLAAAVDAVNVSIGGDPMIAFADPGFGPENAVFAPDRWLWSTTADNALFAGIETDLEIFPEDPLLTFRTYVCPDAESIYGLVVCLYLSVGHPNSTGARAYAAAVVTELRGLGVLPAGLFDG